MSDNTASIDITVPDIGDSESVEVIELLVAVGDEVAVDDSLITLESDKASMEVPASAAGTIESLTVSVGDKVSSGDVIGKMSAAATGTAPEPAAAETAEAEPEPAAAESAATSDAAVTPEVASAPAPEAAAPQADASRSKSPTAHISDESMRKAHASPGVRRYAREHGSDLSLITGTGPKGRILKSDVIGFIKQSMESMNSSYGAGGPGLAGGGAGIPPIPEVDFTKFGEVERVELGRINKLSAQNLHRAWLNLPMVCLLYTSPSPRDRG